LTSLAILASFCKKCSNVLNFNTQRFQQPRTDPFSVALYLGRSLVSTRLHLSNYLRSVIGGASFGQINALGRGKSPIDANKIAGLGLGCDATLSLIAIYRLTR
jgi:hypothetical protein